MRLHTQHFLSGIKCPVLQSNLVAALAGGNVLQVGLLPVALLPTVVLLATIGLRSYQQQIVDDYGLLLARMEQVFKAPELTHRHYFHPQLSLVALITPYGHHGDYWLDQHPECGYMFSVYEELVTNADIDVLFPKDVK
jgi:hypothetical protein